MARFRPVLCLTVGLLMATTAHAAGGLTLSGGSGDVTVAGMTAINGAVGDALSLSTSSGTHSFTGLDIDNPTGDGLALTNNSGSITATGVDLDGIANRPIDVNQGTASISLTLSDTVTNSSDRTVSVTNLTGGSCSISGSLLDINGGGGIHVLSNSGSADIDIDSNLDVDSLGTTAITVTSNSGGTDIDFGGTSKALTTSTAIAANLSTNTGATIGFTGGGLDIDTTGGVGLSANGGGTVEVTGSNNTLDSVSNTALNVVNTTIDANGLNLQSIASGNNTAAADPVNGIVLTNTGTSGGLTVTGVGTTAGSGGTVQRTTGSGILLTNSHNNSLSNMAISTTGLHGIEGTTVRNLDLTGVSVLNAGNAVDENGITLVNLLGTAAASSNNRFDNITVTGAADNGIQVNNNTSTNMGNLSSPDSLTVINSTIEGSGVGGIQYISDTGGTGNMRLNVQSSMFENNTAVGIATNANGGSVQSNITLSNQLIPGAGGGQFRGISGGATSNGQLFFNIDGNPLIEQRGSAGTGPACIAFAAFDTSTLNGTISNNILTSSTPGSGSGGTAVFGISVTNEGSGVCAVSIEDTTITLTDGFGINGAAQGSMGTGTFGVSVTDNSVTLSGNDVANTALTFNNSASSAQNLCINARDNTLSTSPAPNGDIVISNSAAGTFQVQGLGGPVNEAADFMADNQTVEILLSGLQTSAPGGTFINPLSASTMFSPSTCSAPAIP